MVKSRKLSKTSIAVIVLALLLTITMVIGLTGAWFTDSTSGSNTTVVKFGTVDVEMTVTNSVTHNDGLTEAEFTLIDPDNTASSGDEYKEYHIVAGDKILTNFSFTNNSDVEIYYVIAHTGYDSSNANAVEYMHVLHHNAQGTEGQEGYVAAYDELVVISNSQAHLIAKDAQITASTVVYELSGDETVKYGETYFSVNGHAVTAVRGATIEVANGSYELRVVQARNMSGADADAKAASAYTLLTSGWATTNGAATNWQANNG